MFGDADFREHPGGSRACGLATTSAPPGQYVRFAIDGVNTVALPNHAGIFTTRLPNKFFLLADFIVTA